MYWNTTINHIQVLENNFNYYYYQMKRIILSALCLITGATWCNGQQQKTLKVMSYNIRIASPPSTQWGGTDLAAIAKVIKANDPDLVALQEVDAFTERSGKTVDQAKELGAMTGLHYFFAKAVDRSGGDYGVAVLSRYPIVESQAYRLPPHEGSEGEVRGLAFIVVKPFGDNKKVGFISTHLDHMSDADRTLQAEKVLEITEKHKKLPIIFGADLNMQPTNKVMEVIKRKYFMHCTDCPLTFPQVDAKVTIDYLLTNKKANKAFKVENYRTIEEPYASDHHPLMADFTLVK
jgi:endonuclease/exonuclease/phosphatase family metal-dependent hydrolase